MKKLLVKKIEEKEIIWFQNSNSYMIFEPLVSEILLQLDNKTSLNRIKDWALKEIDAPKKAVEDFIEDINSLYIKNNIPIKENLLDLTNSGFSKKNYSEKYYSINNYIFLVQFQNKYLETQIHPTFAHLEAQKQSNFDFHYQTFEEKNNIFFKKNNKLIGTWKKEESHVFQGKLSMQILIDIYKKPEKDWLGVFHASAISNKKESMLFLGNSGNGKSTSLALLNANGFNCIADDFVPIDNEKNIRTYPAAISIKKKSIKTLLPFYPELENTPEHDLKKLNKVVRYLPPKNIDYNLKLKCKALVFIKYDVHIDLEVKSISKIDAFQQLVPDSWISPLEKNAEIFLDWFLALPSYQLTYSNNTKMIETVSKIFNDEL